MGTNNLTTGSFESIFDKQLMTLSGYGCPDEVIWELEDLREKVLNACQQLTTSYQFPLLPVLPKPYLEIAKQLFSAKYGVFLKIKDNEYEDGDIGIRPYYIIGTNLIPKAERYNYPGLDANFNELIPLSILSGLRGPFFAYSGGYVARGLSKQPGKTKDEQLLGIWLNLNGTTGPFLKNDGRYPVTKSVDRIFKSIT